ncbi:MAG: hypothetical protein F6K55_09450 [Moorea sp. SIO4A3]|nr:hypothetical protein [Moorena sp. SIO4A3]
MGGVRAIASVWGAIIFLCCPYPHATTLYSQQREGLIAIAARTTPSFL